MLAVPLAGSGAPPAPFPFVLVLLVPSHTRAHTRRPTVRRPSPLPPCAQKEAELWAEWFIQRPGLPASCAACIGVVATGGSGAGAGLAAPALGGVPVDVVALDAPEAVRKTFDKLVSRVLKKRGG